MLIFIRTDCPISNRYAPTIQRLSAQYAGKAAFWLVYPDKGESSAAIEQHLHEYGYKLPALHDPQHSLVKLGQAQITPEVAVFDASGQLVYHGRIDNWYQDFGHARRAPTTHELDDAIQAVLAARNPKWPRPARWAATSRISNDGRCVQDTCRIRARSCGCGSCGLTGGRTLRRRSADIQRRRNCALHQDSDWRATGARSRSIAISLPSSFTTAHRAIGRARPARFRC